MQMKEIEITPAMKRATMKEMKPVFSFAAALWLVGQSLIPTLLAAETVRTNVTIEVLIFSGRPNPTWQLQSTNLLHTLKVKLKELPTAFEKEPPGWSRLGFAGFRIRGAEAFGLPHEIRIYQGVIKTGQGEAARFQKDTKGLEALLIAEARKQTLPPPVSDVIEKYDNSRKSAR